jgi:hypothetical protein
MRTNKDIVRRLDLLLHIWQVTLVLNTQNDLMKFSHTYHEGKEGRSQHHVLTTLPWERNLVLIDVKGGWAQELVWR